MSNRRNNNIRMDDNYTIDPFATSSTADFRDHDYIPTASNGPQKQQPQRHHGDIKDTANSSYSLYTNNNSLLLLADTLIQNIILHPFVALRRTCQVNRKCSPFICVQPVSLLPFLYHQQRKQGLPALYKGLSSELLVKSMILGSETAIANYSEWPREVRAKRFLTDSLKILALKGISIAISTPFLCSAVKETIQSVIIVRDNPSFLECLRDGFLRLIHLRSTPSARMLPIWLLVVPTVFYHVSHKAIWHVVSKFFQTVRSQFKLESASWTKTRRNVKHRSQFESSITDGWQKDELTYDVSETSLLSDKIETDSNQISNSLFASFIADFALLPVETVLNSLYIQGTRTIIDNVDETTVVLPVLTNFDGFGDCYRAIIKFEGILGLYKGAGAIILQYSLHYLLFRAFYYMAKEFESGSFYSSHTRSRKNVRLMRPDHRRLIQNNRHSTPNNPNEPNPDFESIMYANNSLGLDSSTSKIEPFKIDLTNL